MLVAKKRRYISHKGNELRRVLCLRADNDPCLACELHSWQSHEGKHAIILSHANKKNTFVTVTKVCFFCWRGREDSNFRTGNPAYILSRDASYSLLSTPTSIRLKTECKPLQICLLYNYTQFFCVCQ